VREQSGAAGRAVELMMEVGNGVERIKEASRQQGERTAEVSRANEAMSTAAGRVKEATFTQGRSSGRIASGIERVNTVASEIVKALAEQSAAVDTVGRLLASVNERTLANQESNQKMDDAAQELLDQATTLRDGVRRFEI
jgi:methyl-accepting chemotaxis protein